MHYYYDQELWQGVYLRWVIDQKANDEAWNKIAQIKAYEKELKLKAARLRRLEFVRIKLILKGL